MAVSECDLLFSIGTRFNDRITGKLHSFAPKAQIIHIDIDTAAISKNVKVDVPIVADARDALTRMLEYVEPCETKQWIEQILSLIHIYAGPIADGAAALVAIIFAEREMKALQQGNVVLE